MTRLLASFFLVFVCSVLAYGQTIRRFHQNFEIDEIKTLQLAVDGDVTVNTWSGNTILVEIYIETKVGSPAVINLLQKDGRYDLDIQKSVTASVVVNKVKHRKSIKVKGLDMDETIKYTISVPDSFSAQDQETLRAFVRLR